MVESAGNGIVAIIDVDFFFFGASFLFLVVSIDSDFGFISVRPRMNFYSTLLNEIFCY